MDSPGKYGSACAHNIVGKDECVHFGIRDQISQRQDTAIEIRFDRSNLHGMIFRLAVANQMITRIGRLDGGPYHYRDSTKMALGAV